MNGYVLTKHNKIVVAVDIDEVLGQFLNSLIQFHNDTYGTHLKLSDFHSYEFHEIWGGTPEEASAKIRQFFISDYFADIPTIPHAYEILQELQSWNIFDFVIVTSRQTIIEKATRQWIDKHFPGIFSEMRFGNIYGAVGKKFTKPEMCKELRAEILIDDSLKYGRECSRQGIRVSPHLTPLPPSHIPMITYGQCCHCC